MREYGKVAIRFWQDRRVLKLSETAKLVFLYLLTGPESNCIGCFRMTAHHLAAARVCDADRGEAALREIHATGLIMMDEDSGLVFLPNFLRYNPLTSPAVGKGAVSELMRLPDSPLLDDVVSALGSQGKLPDGWRDQWTDRSGDSSSDSSLDRSGAPHPHPHPHPQPQPQRGERAHARTSAAGPDDRAPAAAVPDKLPPLPASQAETGKATTANVSATPAQLEMLAGLATKRGLRLPDVCQALGIAMPVPKAEVDRIIAHLEAIPPVPPADRKRRQAADQAPVLWGDVSRMLDAGDVQGAHDALRGAREPDLRRHVLRQLVAYLGQRGDLTGAMLAVGSDHDTLIRDLPVVWEALLSSKRYTAHEPPGTGVTESESREWVQ